ncbi:hypothetical protein GQ607_000085, partial [Colletotrichum asianum]
RPPLYFRLSLFFFFDACFKGLFWAPETEKPPGHGYMPPPPPHPASSVTDMTASPARLDFLFPCDVDEVIFDALARSILPCRVSS